MTALLLKARQCSTQRALLSMLTSKCSKTSTNSLSLKGLTEFSQSVFVPFSTGRRLPSADTTTWTAMATSAVCVTLTLPDLRVGQSPFSHCLCQQQCLFHFSFQKEKFAKENSRLTSRPSRLNLASI